MPLTSRLIVTVVAALAAVASAGAVAPGDGVTLTVQTFYDAPNHIWRVRFSGAVSSGAVNESVTVLAQKCGQSFSTAVAGASTVEGGRWEVVPDTPVVGGKTPATYRARWNSTLSEPVTVRPPILVFAPRKLSRRRYRVTVYTEAPRSMQSRLVELQRLAVGGWTRVRLARLVPDQLYGSFQATFTVRTRGLTLRMLVPARTAAPCYTAAASKTWVS